MLQWVAILTVERPVTQIVETAVKKASTNAVGVFDRAEIGSIRIRANMKMMSVNEISANREGDELMKLFSHTLKLKRVPKAVEYLLFATQKHLRLPWYSFGAIT